MPGQVENANNVMLGRGKVYFDRMDSDGNLTGEIFLGNCPSFEITPSAEEIKLYSSATAAGDLLCSDVLRTTLALRINGSEFSKENVAMALFAGSSSLEQTGDSVTDEVLCTLSSLQGRFFPTVFRDISVVTVTGPAGTPEYLVDEDYVVDGDSGRIYIVEGGDIADGSTVETDYTYGTIDLETVLGMTVGAVKGLIRFIGDPARGPKWEVIIWKASVRSDGAIAFIGDEYGSWNLAGEIESMATAHPTEPHFRMIKVA